MAVAAPWTFESWPRCCFPPMMEQRWVAHLEPVQGVSGAFNHVSRATKRTTATMTANRTDAPMRAYMHRYAHTYNTHRYMQTKQACTHTCVYGACCMHATRPYLLGLHGMTSCENANESGAPLIGFALVFSPCPSLDRWSSCSVSRRRTPGRGHALLLGKGPLSRSCGPLSPRSGPLAGSIRVASARNTRRWPPSHVVGLVVQSSSRHTSRLVAGRSAPRFSRPGGHLPMQPTNGLLSPVGSVT